MSLPVIDVEGLRGGDAVRAGRIADEIGAACREHGFFYISGHGVDRGLQDRLVAASRAFFALPDDRKAAIAMARGGRAWRGWFPVGDELTSGEPDQKEGIYFGAELPEDDPRVQAGWPLHGENLLPDADVPEMRATVLEWIDTMTRLGHTLMRGIALSLGLPADYFEADLTRDPLVLFRVFHYPPLTEPPLTEPPLAEPRPKAWSVGEHTDYGLLTILFQDDKGGLQVKTGGRFVDAPPIPDTFVCNIGDMLDRITSGRYRSTPHRVRNPSQQARLSFPFFFDPGFEAAVAPIDPALPISDDARQRWDGASVHAFDGSYGDYLVAKVGRVFPDLSSRALRPLG